MIKNIILVGLGAVGSVFASKIPDIKVLVDKMHNSTRRIINEVSYEFNMVSVEKPEKADLIIVATKFYNLEEINFEPFIKEGTIILSLINGILSEDVLKEQYPNANIIKSFLICNSMIKQGSNVIHDDYNQIVLESNFELESFFKSHNINYKVSDDIYSDMWGKYMLNLMANQLSAVTRMTFGEMNNLPYIDKLLNNILEEVVIIAEKEGVLNARELGQGAIKIFKNMAPYGKTSMLQDIISNKKTEIEAFAGTIRKLGIKHNVKTPYNDVFYLLLR